MCVAIKRLFLGVVLLCPAAGFGADLEMVDPWVREAPPGSPMGGYFTLRNHGSSPRHLVSADAEDFGMTMLHRSVNVGGVMKMEHVHSAKIGAGAELVFQPGGYHIMLMQPQKEFLAGSGISITLGFKDGTRLESEFVVKSMDHSGDSQEREPHSGHGSGSTGPSPMHDGHGMKHEMHGENAPQLQVHTHKTDSGQWMLMIATENFAFSKEHQDGDHVDGEGHAHLYVDGEKIARVFSSRYELPHLVSGEYETRVGLFTNNHMAYAVDGEPQLSNP